MIRVLTSVLLVLLLLSPVYAQQKDQPAEVKAGEKKAITSLPLTPEERERMIGLIQSPEFQARSQVAIVVKNGSVYFALGDILVPMSGGGASGCFGDNLRERIGILRQVIKTLRTTR